MPPGGRFAFSGITAKMLIMQAYDVKEFQVTGAPGWISSDRYDINAKAERPNVDPDQAKVLVQSLLAERFNLKFHREIKEFPIYALVVAKDGPKLKKSENQTESEIRAATAGPGGGGPKEGRMLRLGRGHISAQMLTLGALVQRLSSSLGRPVVDRTGLTGLYDFDLQWAPDEMEVETGKSGERMPAESAPAGESTGPSIFTALQEQLGLKLESQKGPVEILVIDRMEKPTEN